ncbi:uncharacterized protein EV422DRAFT_568085 [Fimicolochytrium jonesii]|uniref:uncharacterized protein n=1 Tax=Fimicolochytrium jonesii TaxID=1396493 RepID=UPI0022FE5399|nr:uncharacterized protein EV422DRAFT_568085 [Fimicolochytrium jonesii]KAI8820130.1 hypothetical protein EV422DRAFT_568085 [Fimicolochytrium jonesii]
MPNHNVRIFIVGPSGTGKTTLSNVLADLTASLPTAPHAGGVYRATQGVRILEFDRRIPPLPNSGSTRPMDVACEVWDCSGSPRFTASWPALTPSAHAVIFVASGETRERDLEAWHSQFPHLPPSSMVLFSPYASKSKPFKPTSNSPLHALPVVTASWESDPEVVRQEFDRVLAGVVGEMVGGKRGDAGDGGGDWAGMERVVV